MSMLKRALATILMVAIVISCVPVTMASGSQAGMRIVSGGYSGGILTIKVQVMVPQPVGFGGISTMISYDSSKLTLVDSDNPATTIIPTTTPVAISIANSGSEFPSDYIASGSGIYGKDDRAILYINLLSISPPALSNTGWNDFFTFKFKTTGDPDSNLNSDSIRFADPTRDEEAIENVYPGSSTFVNIFYQAGQIERYNYGQTLENTSASLPVNNFLMSAPGNNTATYPGSTNVPPKDTPIVTVPTAASATYGQTLADIALIGGSASFNSTGVLGSFDWKDGTLSVGNASATPKNFKAVFTPDETATYNSVEVDVAVTVGKKTINDVAVSPISAMDYTGSQLTPAVTVTGDSGKTLANSDYTVEYGTNTTPGANAGSVTIKAAASGNYTFSDVTADFTINQVAGSLNISNPGTITYDMQAISYGTSGTDLVYTYTGDGTPSAKFYNDNSGTKGTEIGSAPTDAGTYWFGVSATAGTNSLAVAEVTKQFTILPATYSYTYSGTTSAVIGGNHPATDNSATATGISSETVDGTLTWYTNAARTVPANTTFTQAVNTTLYWRFTPDASETNYVSTPFDGSAVFAVSNLPPHVFDNAFSSNENKTYGDAPISKTATLTTGSGAISYTSNNTNVASVDPTSGLATIMGAGSATITASAAGTATHAPASISYTISSAPKSIGVDVTATNREFDGTNTVDLSGTVVAADVLNSDDVTAQVPATGTMTTPDVGNNKPVTISGTVTLGGTKAGNYVITTQPTGVTVNITASSLASKQPTISGTASVGNILTANIAGVAPGDVTYKWYRDGIEIVGQTARTYTLVAEDSNSAITVEANALSGNYSGTTQRSSATTIAKMAVSGTVSIVETNGGGLNGAIDTGDTLTANLGSVSPTIAQTGGTFQWFRNNVVIGGANSNSYTIVKADAGTTIKVEYTHPKTSGTLQASRQVEKIAMSGTTSMSGANTLGGTAQASFSDASMAYGTDYQIVWLRNGVAIPGATGQSYVIQKADQGKTITARAVGLNGYTGNIDAATGFSIPAAVPDAPSVSAVPNDKQITLRWSAPFDNGSPITGYVVQIDSEPEISIGANTPYHTFTGLTNGTSYNFKVRATNAIGDSVTVSLNAVPAIPPAEPTTPVDYDRGYAMTGGTSQIVGRNMRAKFTANIPFGEFTGIWIDGISRHVEEIADVYPGSTVVELKASFINTLSPGKHTISIVGIHNQMANGEFYVMGDGGQHVNPQTDGR